MDIQGLTITPNSGSATSGTQVSFSATATTGRGSRSKTVQAKATGGNSVNLNVTQAGADAFINSTDPSIVVKTGATVTVTGETNCNQFQLIPPASTSGISIQGGQFNGSTITSTELTNGFTMGTEGSSSDPGYSAKFNWNISFTVEANPVPSSRSWDFTIESEDGTSSVGTTFTITQAGGDAWVKVNGGTSAVSVLLNSSGTMTSTKPSVSSNTTWSIS